MPELDNVISLDNVHALTADNTGVLVRQLLCRALESKQVQSPTAAVDAEAYQRRLALELQVHTVVQLITAICDTSNAQRRGAECRAILRENLTEALHTEVHRLLSGPAKTLLAPAERRVVRMQFTRIDVLQMSNISQKTQSFDVELFLQATIVNGSEDPDLAASNDGFPVNAAGKPTFRPSAKWFLGQADFQTPIKPLTTRVASVVRGGQGQKDIQLNKKINWQVFSEDGAALRI